MEQLRFSERRFDDGCSIEHDGAELFLRDLGSSGGTYLDGEKVERVRLQDGMEFNVGPAILKFYESGI